MFARICFIFIFCYSFIAFGQTQKQKELEQQRAKLQQEIEKVNKLLFKNNQKEKDILGYLNALNKKIEVRTNFIRAIERESNYILNNITQKQHELDSLQNELNKLKSDYAAMIYKSYQSKSEQSKLMFLLSSEDFFQAYKRYRYMQQYAKYRKKQGDSIVVKSEIVAVLTAKLQKQKQKKDALASKNKIEAQKIENEKKTQQSLAKDIERKKRHYTAQIRRKQKEEKRINEKIERVIREAIAASRKKASKKSGGNNRNTTAKVQGFALTPQGKILATNFQNNRGKLPWPVTEGIVTRNYGKISHPTLPGIKIDSKGIHITTKKNATARTVFKGTVLAIQSVSGRYAVYVQHGNYISLYNNLDKVYVTKGQELLLKQSIGTVFTDKVTDKTILKFQIWKNTQRQNPTYWLARM